MNKKVQFLTSNTLDKNKILNVLKTHIDKNNNSEDQKILKKIIQFFDDDELSFLSNQEIQFLNLHSSKIWAKYLIFRYKFIFNTQKHIVSEFPLYLLIEPVSACNLRCTMCFQVDESFSSDKNFMGKMDLELFKKIIDQAYEGGTQAITLASRGEPTMHPQLDEMLNYCNGKFLELKINTNATLLTEKLSYKILKSDITDIVFSVDSYKKEEYEKIRVNGIFEKVLNNIKKFQEIRNTSFPNSKCTTRISGVKVMKEQDPVLFKQFWEQYVDHVVIVEMEPRWDTYNNPLEFAGKGPCHLLWERMYVWYDGISNVCDADYKSKLSPGSIKNKSIKEIWNGDKYTQLRNSHKNGMRSECTPCDRCPYGS